MTMADTYTLNSFVPSRRLVLQVVGLGAAGFAVGCSPDLSATGAASANVAKTALGPFVKIGSDNTVTVILKHLEMGQGVSTGLTTIVAEELDAAWSQLRFEHSPADNALYGNTAFGGMMGTGGSTAIFNSWDQLRKAGAGARAMLVQAGAAKWKVEPASVTVADGVVSSGNRKATFGELAAEAAAIAPPAADTLKLKDPASFRFIGKDRQPDIAFGRLDNAAKINGTAQYALDYHPEGTLTALLA